MNMIKHKRTDAMIRNIKKLQIEKEYSDTEVAEQIGITPTTYKNIIRSRDSGGNKTIKDSIVNKLADFYDCSTDYVLGLSDDKTLNRYGESVKRPLDFSDRDKLIYELNNYLNSDYKTLYALHFFLCQSPSWRRAEYLKGFHALTDTLMEHSRMERLIKSSGDIFEVMSDETMKYNEDYFNHVLKLYNGNQSLCIADFSNSLKNYIQIIYDTLTQSLTYVPIAHKAAAKVLWLKKNWSAFPTELNIITDTLPQIQYNSFHIEKLTMSEEIVITLKDYLDSQNN